MKLFFKYYWTLMVFAAFSALLLCAVNQVRADRYSSTTGETKSEEQLKAYFESLSWGETRVTANLAGGATFYGYATQVSIVCTSGPITWHTNYRANLSSVTFYTGDFSQEFYDYYAPLSSPTIITMDTLASGASMQILIKGLK